MNPKQAALISGQLAQYAANLRYEDLPEDVRKLAHLALLDTLGCAMAGAGTDEVSQGAVVQRRAREVVGRN